MSDDEILFDDIYELHEVIGEKEAAKQSTVQGDHEPTVTLGYIDAARRFVFESEIRWHVN